MTESIPDHEQIDVYRLSIDVVAFLHRIACTLSYSAWVGLGCLFATFSAIGSEPVSEPKAELFFESDVRPILKTHCFHCHGEAEVRESGLDVRLVHLLKKGGDAGPAIAAGSATDSLLFKRISAGEMPPGGKTLTEREKAILERWLNNGAPTKRAEPASPLQEEWTEEERGFWIFQPVSTPAIPPIDPRDSETVATPIDPFILQKLREKQLALSPISDRATLIRRLSFDLIGIPPTPDEVSDFLADTQIDAYERLIDRLLSDPRHGEHWARPWLDVAG